MRSCLTPTLARIVGGGAVVLFVLAGFGTGTEPAEAAARVSGVPQVLDGDTLAFGERRVRLYGIDAPETEQTCEILGETAPIGIWATRTLRRLIGNGTVTCSGVGHRRGDHMVGRCRTDAFPSLGRALVKSGFAWDDESRGHGIYADAEAEARAGRLGVWAGESPCVPPWEWRRYRR